MNVSFDYQTPFVPDSEIRTSILFNKYSFFDSIPSIQDALGLYHIYVDRDGFCSCFSVSMNRLRCEIATLSRELKVEHSNIGNMH